jgi:hypothetical protein
VIRRLLWLLVAAAIFAAGVALGRALHDNPKPGITVTTVRTLHPRAARWVKKEQLWPSFQ